MQNYIEIWNVYCCCAIGELAGISRFRGDSEGVIRDLVVNEDYDYDKDTDIEFLDLSSIEYSHLIFTQASAQKDSRKTGYGYKLRNYIESNQLGSVVASEAAKNPNSRNYVVVFTWVVSKKGLVAWAKRKGIGV